MRLLTNPMTWHVLAGVSAMVFVVGAIATEFHVPWFALGLLGGLVALAVECWLDPEGFWERNEDGMDF